MRAPRLALLGAALGVASFAVALTACVDGTTPDCSSPDAGCDPSAVEEGGSDAPSDGTADAPTDAPADSPADAPDGD